MFEILKNELKNIIKKNNFWYFGPPYTSLDLSLEYHFRGKKFEKKIIISIL